MGEYERIHVSDGLKEVYYNEGETIIKQGDDGSMFYMILSGELVAMKLIGMFIQVKLILIDG
jgi:CRP-like cAMP-binding protein